MPPPLPESSEQHVTTNGALRTQQSHRCRSLWTQHARTGRTAAKQRSCVRTRMRRCAPPAAGVGSHDLVFAGVPFRQWLSPNGQWRVRPIR